MRSESLIGVGGVYLYLYTLSESRVVWFTHLRVVWWFQSLTCVKVQ
jgi:hypothetical protein